jgi:DNA polymerase III subunit epsilon
MFENIRFLEIQASSLRDDSWPIEIGIARLDQAGSLMVESHIIKPSASWPAASWSPFTANSHGISYESLDSGVPAREAARMTYERLAGHFILSDFPGWHMKWLNKLLLCDPETSYLDVWSCRSFLADRFPQSPGIEQAYVKETTEHKAIRRAGPDVARVANAFLRAMEALRN